MRAGVANLNKIPVKMHTKSYKFSQILKNTRKNAYKIAHMYACWRIKLNKTHVKMHTKSYKFSQILKNTCKNAYKIAHMYVLLVFLGIRVIECMHFYVGFATSNIKVLVKF